MKALHEHHNSHYVFIHHPDLDEISSSYLLRSISSIESLIHHLHIFGSKHQWKPFDHICLLPQSNIYVIIICITFKQNHHKKNNRKESILLLSLKRLQILIIQLFLLLILLHNLLGSGLVDRITILVMSGNTLMITQTQPFTYLLIPSTVQISHGSEHVLGVDFHLLFLFSLFSLLFFLHLSLLLLLLLGKTDYRMNDRNALYSSPLSLGSNRPCSPTSTQSCPEYPPNGHRGKGEHHHGAILMT